MRNTFRNRKLRGIGGAFLLIIFSGFFVSVTFFPHSHIVDGFTIVHSHPYKKVPDNFPAPHNHSKNALVLIQFQSVIQTLAVGVLAGTILVRKAVTVIKMSFRKEWYSSPYSLEFNRPRAPTA